jgi:hypothetical protein
MNALTHGVCARQICVSGEDHDKFEALAFDYRERLRPTDGYESRLVDQLIVLHWHMDRLRFIQGFNLQLEIERLDLRAGGYNPAIPESHRVPIAYAALTENSRVIEATNRELTRISREYARIHKTLIDTRIDCPPADEAVISPVQNEPNGPEPEPVTPRPTAPAGTPARNEPNAALAGCAILLAPKPQPAEPAPPLIFSAA